jgi:hypothetical protein
MELTLISIIQGVALYFLIDSSRALLVDLQLLWWPYVVAGLMMILLFWSRALIHTFTVIHWPLEFGHNFLYIGCTLVQSIMFTQIRNLSHWSMLGTIYCALVWFTFRFDLRMIRRRRRESGGPAGAELFALLEREQIYNVRVVMPAATAFYGVVTVIVFARPDLAAAMNLAMIVGVAQLAASIGYLVYVLRFYRKICPLVLTSRREELA